MSKFTVNVISLSLTGNKIAKFGEIVEAIQLNGNAEQLVKEGFILPLESKKDTEKSKDIDVKDIEVVEPKKETKK